MATVSRPVESTLVHVLDVYIPFFDFSDDREYLGAESVRGTFPHLVGRKLEASPAENPDLYSGYSFQQNASCVPDGSRDVTPGVLVKGFVASTVASFLGHEPSFVQCTLLPIYEKEHQPSS